MHLIDCKKLCLSYDGKQVVNDLTFEVNSGDYLCIVGENGSGKSTLVKAILGLKQPQSGSIEYGNGLKSNEIGYLPQQTLIQKDFPASVYEVVCSGCLNKRTPFFTKSDKITVEKNLRLLDIDNIKRQCYRELSGGQQQRVLLARALCATKKLLLLDEPVTGLDPVMTHDMYSLISRLNSENSITVIMVSHDIHCAVEHSSKVLHLGNHKMAFFGSKADYVNSPTGRYFLGGCEYV